jgi:hypothetical protein
MTAPAPSSARTADLRLPGVVVERRDADINVMFDRFLL